MINKNFGENLKKARESRILEIEDLALITKIPATYINMYEDGTRIPNEENLQKLISALGSGLDNRLLSNQEFFSLPEFDLNYYKCESNSHISVLHRANGICDLCNSPAPFIRNNGEPFLLFHKINDEVSAALCPNCKAKMVELPCKGEIEYLKAKLDMFTSRFEAKKISSNEYEVSFRCEKCNDVPKFTGAVALGEPLKYKYSCTCGATYWSSTPYPYIAIK